MNSPIVTILTPVFNGGKTIGKSIETVLNQTFKNWLMVIVNDGSTDNTLAVIDQYKDHRIQVVHLEQNKGRPHARQRALEQVTTKYFCFLDADDAYYPNKLQNQIEFMNNNSQYALLSNAIGIVDKNKELISVLSNPEGELFFNSYHLYKKVPHASSIIRTSALGSVSYDMSLKYTQDQDFLRRLLLNKKYYFQAKIKYIYNREDSFSFRKYKESLLLENKSIRKLDTNNLRNIRRTFMTFLKIFIMFFLNIFKLEKFYMKNMGQTPTTNQIKEYEKSNL